MEDSKYLSQLLDERKKQRQRQRAESPEEDNHTNSHLLSVPASNEIALDSPTGPLPVWNRQILSSIALHPPVILPSISGQFRSLEYGILASDDELSKDAACRLVSLWRAQLGAVFSDSSHILFDSVSAEVRRFLASSAASQTSPVDEDSIMVDNSDPAIVPLVDASSSESISGVLFITALRFVLGLLASEGKGSVPGSVASSPALNQALQTVIDMAIQLPMCSFRASNWDGAGVIDSFFETMLEVVRSAEPESTDDVCSLAFVCAILVGGLLGQPHPLVRLGAAVPVTMLRLPLPTSLQSILLDQIDTLRSSVSFVLPDSCYLRRSLLIAPDLSERSHAPVGTRSLAVAPSGQWVYVHGAAGILKIGTGANGTCPGQVYTRRAQLFAHDTSSSMCCTPSHLLYRSSAIAPAVFVVLDPETLEELGRVHPTGDGSWKTRDESAHSSFSADFSANSQAAPRVALASRKSRRKSHQRSRSDETQRLSVIVRDLPSRERLREPSVWVDQDDCECSHLLSSGTHVLLVTIRKAALCVVLVDPTANFEVVCTASIALAGLDSVSSVKTFCDSNALSLLESGRKSWKVAKISLRGLLAGTSRHVSFTSIPDYQPSPWAPIQANSSYCLAWDACTQQLWCGAGADILLASFGSVDSCRFRSEKLTMSNSVSDLLTELLLCFPSAPRVEVYPPACFDGALDYMHFPDTCALGLAVVDLIFQDSLPGGIPTEAICSAFSAAVQVCPPLRRSYLEVVWIRVFPVLLKHSPDEILVWLSLRATASNKEARVDRLLGPALAAIAQVPSLVCESPSSVFDTFKLSLKAVVHLALSVPSSVGVVSDLIDSVSHHATASRGAILQSILLQLTTASSVVPADSGISYLLARTCRTVSLLLESDSAAAQRCMSALLSLQRFVMDVHNAEVCSNRSCNCFPAWFSGAKSAHDCWTSPSLAAEVPESVIDSEIHSPASGTQAGDSNSDTDFVRLGRHVDELMYFHLQAPRPSPSGPYVWSRRVMLPPCSGVWIDIEPQSALLLAPDIVLFSEETGFLRPMRLNLSPACPRYFLPSTHIIARVVSRPGDPHWALRLSLKPMRGRQWSPLFAAYCTAVAACSSSCAAASTIPFRWEQANHPLELPKLLSSALFRDSGFPVSVAGSSNSLFCLSVVRRTGIGAAFLAWRSSVEQDSRISDDSLSSQSERIALAAVLWHCNLVGDAICVAQLHAANPKARMAASVLRDRSVSYTELVRACHAVRTIRDSNLVENQQELIRKGLCLLQLPLVAGSPSRQHLAVQIIHFLLSESLTLDAILQAVQDVKLRLSRRAAALAGVRVLLSYSRSCWSSASNDDALALASKILVASSLGFDDLVGAGADEKLALSQLLQSAAEIACDLVRRAACDPSDLRKYSLALCAAIPLSSFLPSPSARPLQAALQRSSLIPHDLPLSSSAAEICALGSRLVLIQTLVDGRSTPEAEVEHRQLLQSLRHELCDRSISRLKEVVAALHDGELPEDTQGADGRISALILDIQVRRLEIWDFFMLNEVQTKLGSLPPQTPSFWRTLSAALAVSPPQLRPFIIRAMRRYFSANPEDAAVASLRDTVSLVGALSFWPLFSRQRLENRSFDLDLLFRTQWLPLSVANSLVEGGGEPDACRLLSHADPVLSNISCLCSRPWGWQPDHAAKRVFVDPVDCRRVRVTGEAPLENLPVHLLANRALSDALVLHYWEVTVVATDSPSSVWSASIGLVDALSNASVDSDSILPDIVVPGDTLGCGWLSADGIVFFTWNAVCAPQFLRNVHGRPIPVCSVKLVGSADESGRTSVELLGNFGDRPHQFDVSAIFSAQSCPPIFNSSCSPYSQSFVSSSWMHLSAISNDLANLVRERFALATPALWLAQAREGISSLSDRLQCLDGSSDGLEEPLLAAVSQSNDSDSLAELAHSLGILAVLGSCWSLVFPGSRASVSSRLRSCVVVEVPLSSRSDAMVGVVYTDSPQDPRMHYVPTSSVSVLPKATLNYPVLVSSAMVACLSNITKQMTAAESRGCLSGIDVAALARMRSMLFAAILDISADESTPISSRLTAADAVCLWRLTSSDPPTARNWLETSYRPPLLVHLSTLAECSYNATADSMPARRTESLNDIGSSESNSSDSAQSDASADHATANNQDEIADIEGSQPDTEKDTSLLPPAASLAVGEAVFVSSPLPMPSDEVFIGKLNAQVGRLGLIVALDDSQSLALVRFGHISHDFQCWWFPQACLSSTASSPTSRAYVPFLQPEGIFDRHTQAERNLSHGLAREICTNIVVGMTSEYSAIASESDIKPRAIFNWRRRASSLSTASIVLMSQLFLDVLRTQGSADFVRSLLPRPDTAQALTVFRDIWADLCRQPSPRLAIDAPVKVGEDQAESPSTSARIQGYLTKQGKMFKQWKKYWCVVEVAEGSVLAYFRSPDANQPTGVIDLTRVSAVESSLAVDREKKAKADKVTFHLLTDSKVISLQAPTPEEKDRWVTALQETISKAMVPTTPAVEFHHEGAADPITTLISREFPQLLRLEFQQFESNEELSSPKTTRLGTFKLEPHGSGALVIRIGGSITRRITSRCVHLVGSPHLLVEFHHLSSLPDHSRLRLFQDPSRQVLLGAFVGFGASNFRPFVVLHADRLFLELECIPIGASFPILDDASVSVRVSPMQYSSVGGAFGPSWSSLSLFNWLLDAPSGSLTALGLVPVCESRVWPAILDLFTAALSPFEKISLHSRLAYFESLALLLRRWRELCPQNSSALTSFFSAANELFARYSEEIKAFSGSFSKYCQRLFEVVAALHSLRLELIPDDARRVSSVADPAAEPTTTTELGESSESDLRRPGTAKETLFHPWFYEMASIYKAVEALALSKPFPASEAHQAFFYSRSAEFSATDQLHYLPLVHESPHPYPPGVRVTSRVFCSKAKYLIVSFDLRSRTRRDLDRLLFSTDRAGGDDLGSFSGSFPTEELVFNGDSFVWSFISQPIASLPFWGFQFTVTPIFSDEGKAEISNRVAEDLTSLAADPILPSALDFSLSRLLDDASFSRRCSARELHPRDIWPSPTTPGGETIRALGFPAFSRRLQLIKHINSQVIRLLPMVDLSLAATPGAAAWCLCRIKGTLLYEVKYDILLSQLTSPLSADELAIVAVSRGSAECTFLQCYQQIAHIHPSQFWHLDRCFTVRFVGEGSIDLGGPYRDVLSRIVSDFPLPALRLFAPSPNTRHQVGSHQDQLVPLPFSELSAARQHFLFVGQVIGIAIRSAVALDIKFPSAIWKLLVCAPLNRRDILQVDIQLHDLLELLENPASKGVTQATFESAVDMPFTVADFGGVTHELTQHGSARAVTWANRREFVRLVEKFKFAEFSRAVSIIKEGVQSVVGDSFVFSLFSWREMELLVCGRQGFDVTNLQRHTVYADGMSPTEPCVQYFWGALRSMSARDQAALLRFVCGRSRLAPDSDATFTIAPLVKSLPSPDQFLPEARTCFFSLYLPAYSSQMVTTQKLHQAIQMCQEIDADFRVSDMLDVETVFSDDELE